ncbi:Rv3235 family protein [Rhodococcus aerolatus]
MTAQPLSPSPEPQPQPEPQPPAPSTQLPSPGPRLCVVRPVPRYEPEPDGPTTARLARHLVAVPGPPGAGAATDRTTTATPPAGPLHGDRADPATRDAAAALLRTVLEVLDRRRPAAHLAGVLAPALHQRVAASMVAAHRGRPPAQLRSVRAQRSGPGAAEVSARLQRGPRSHALAARVELVGGRWVATALRIA